MVEKYKPLPKELRLGFSKIHDIGLFAKEKIKMGHDFGISHIQLGKELIRTPLGGFIMIFQQQWITKRGDSLLLVILKKEKN